MGEPHATLGNLSIKETIIFNSIIMTERGSSVKEFYFCKQKKGIFFNNEKSVN